MYCIVDLESKMHSPVANSRVSLDMLSVQGNIERAWEEKEPKAFWRGRDSSRERLKLMVIARENPDLFNVSMTNYFFFRDQEKVYGKSKHVSFFKFFDVSILNVLSKGCKNITTYSSTI